MTSNLPDPSHLNDASIFGLASLHDTETLHSSDSNRADASQIAREVSEFLAIPVMKPFRRRAIKTFFRQMSGALTDAVVEAAYRAYRHLGYCGQRPTDTWSDDDQRRYPIPYPNVAGNTAKQVARVLYWHSGQPLNLAAPPAGFSFPGFGWLWSDPTRSHSGPRPSWNWVRNRETEPVKLLVLEWFATDCIEYIPKMREFAGKPYLIDAVKAEIKSPAWLAHLEILLAMHMVVAFEDELTSLFLKLLALSYLNYAPPSADPFSGLAPGILEAVVDLDKAVWGGSGIGGPGQLIDATLESAWLGEISTFNAYEAQKWADFGVWLQHEFHQSCCADGHIFPSPLPGDPNDLLGPPQDAVLQQNIPNRSVAQVLHRV